MAEYYAQQASAGLIIAEATTVIEGNSPFWMEPGIYSDAQVKGWKTVTDAVHAKGGQIVLQLWHGTRPSKPLLRGKLDAVAFGTSFLANPDLPARFASKASLNIPSAAKFYSRGPEGYTDYPALSAA